MPTYWQQCFCRITSTISISLLTLMGKLSQESLYQIHNHDFISDQGILFQIKDFISDKNVYQIKGS